MGRITPPANSGTSDVPPSAVVKPPATATIISNFQSGHGWAAANVGSSEVNDTTDYLFGSQSARITADNALGSAIIQIGTLSLNLTDKQLVLWCKVDDIAKVGGITLRLGTSGYSTNYFTLTPAFGATTYAALGSNEWMPLTFGWNQATTTGTPDRANITHAQIRMSCNGAQNPTLRVNRLAHEPEPATWPNGVVSLAFDDGAASQYTRAAPRMDLYGYPGTLYLIADKVGMSNYLTLAQVKELKNLHGWEIASHAYTTANHDARLPNLSDAELVSEFRNMKRYIVENGLGTGDHLAYPGGQFDADVEAIARRFFASCRMTHNTPRQTWPPRYLTRLRGLSITSGTSTATIQAEIDAAYANQTWLILIFHDVVASGATGDTQYNAASFNTVIDYLNTKGIPVKTVGDVLAGNA